MTWGGSQDGWYLLSLGKPGQHGWMELGHNGQVGEATGQASALLFCHFLFCSIFPSSEVRGLDGFSVFLPAWLASENYFVKGHELGKSPD